MNKESIRLTLAGLVIGVLAFSATAVTGLGLLSRSAGETGASEALGPPGEEAVPAMAEAAQTAATEAPQDPDAGPFLVALRVPDPIPGEKLFLCDPNGCPLEEVLPDSEGDAALGPLAPGFYTLWRGGEQVGSFRLRDNAALTEAQGRLWTDGELLHLERFVSGTVRLTLSLDRQGYYTLQLRDRDGRSWTRDLYIPAYEDPAAGQWVRVLEFRGLPPGLYTLVRRNRPLGQVQVAAGETAELAVTLKIEN